MYIHIYICTHMLIFARRETRVVRIPRSGYRRGSLVFGKFIPRESESRSGLSLTFEVTHSHFVNWTNERLVESAGNLELDETRTPISSSDQ